MAQRIHPPIEKNDVKEVLLRLIQEYFSQIRHYDTQRSTISNLLVIVSAAILAFVTYDKAFTKSDLPLTVLLFLIGLFGAGSCLKYYERAAFNSGRFRSYREKLDEVLFDSKLIRVLREEADKQHNKDFHMLREGTLSWVKVHRLWIIFHLLIALLGLILTVSAIFWPTASAPVS